MDAVELPLPAAIVTKIMRSSGCSGGGGVTRVELLGNQSERETCTSSFHPEKDDKCNVNGSRPAFWNKMSDEDLYRQAGQSSSLRNEEAFIDHDMASVPEAKQSQRKSGKTARSNGNSSRRSRAAHMEASLNVTGVVDVNDQLKELGSYPGKCNISEKTQTAKQKTSVSGKRSDKRNGKVPKSKCDSFSVKAGLSSFSSAAGGNNILGVYGSKHDICDFAKHVDELSLNELLDGSFKCPKSIKDKEKETEILNGSILLSVREACSILQLQKPTHTPNVATVDGTYNHIMLHLAYQTLPLPEQAQMMTIKEMQQIQLLVTRYLAHGRPTTEESIGWERLRSPAVDASPYDLHASDCLADLQPGDHFEIQ